MSDRRFPADTFPAVVAHRGASSTHPENTLASFEEAVRLGAPIVELDVRLSSDGVPVVLHDPLLERTTDGSGAVHERTAAEIATLRAGPGGEGVPTLADALALMSGRVAVALEIKVLPGEPAYAPGDEAVVRATHDALDGVAFAGPALVMSFNPEWIAASKALARSAESGNV